MGENKQISQVGEFQMICTGAPPSRRGRLIPLIKLRLGASQLVLVVKNLLANAGDLRDLGSVPGLGRSPGRGHGNPLQYACRENPHGQRSLAGYSSWGHEELDTAEGPEHACLQAQAAQRDFLPNCMEWGEMHVWWGNQAKTISAR